MRHKVKPRIIYNDDTCTINVVTPPFTRDKIALAEDYLKGSQVDVLCWKVYRRFTAGWPSKVCQSIYETYWNEHPDKSHKANSLRLDLYREGVDYLPILIEQTRSRGMRFYASFRMNDCHHRSRPGSAAAFWKTHQHYRLWEVTDGRTYYNAALDYSYPDVRQQIFDAIIEFAEMYNVDGIELDFYRNPYIFQPSEAWKKRDILSEFVKDIRTKLAAIGRERGRIIDLLARVPFDRDHFTGPGKNRLRLAGMDIDRWIKEKYMDILVMTYGLNNYNQQVEPWRSLCRDNDVLFYPSIEAGPATNAAHNWVVRETPDQIIRRQRAMAQNFLSQDVDGIYMYNYPCLLPDRQDDPDAFAAMAGVLSDLGSAETLKGKTKQYTFWENLPITIESNRPPQYHQTIKFHINDQDIDDNDPKVTLKFRQVAERNPHAKGQFEQDPIVSPDWITYIVNGCDISAEHIKHIVQPAGQLQSGFTVTDHQLVDINCPSEIMVNGENSLAFHILRFPEERDPYINIYELIVDVEVSALYGV